MNYSTYVNELLELNRTIVTPCQMPSAPVFNNLAWGLVEEVEEYREAKPQDKLKEAGDVLAYTTLLLLCNAYVEEVAETLTYKCYRPFYSLEYFSNLKRVNREGAKFNWLNAFAAWSEVYKDAKEIHSLSFEQIAQANIGKLKDRLSRNVLFSGSGDNR